MARDYHREVFDSRIPPRGQARRHRRPRSLLPRVLHAGDGRGRRAVRRRRGSHQPQGPGALRARRAHAAARGAYWDLDAAPQVHGPPGRGASRRCPSPRPWSIGPTGRWARASAPPSTMPPAPRTWRIPTASWAAPPCPCRTRRARSPSSSARRGCRASAACTWAPMSADASCPIPRSCPCSSARRALRLPVLLHPINVIGAERLKPFYLVNLLGNPFDSAIAAAHLVFGGVLDRLPEARGLPAPRGRRVAVSASGGSATARRCGPRTGRGEEALQRVSAPLHLRHHQPRPGLSRVPRRRRSAPIASSSAPTSASTWATSGRWRPSRPRRSGSAGRTRTASSGGRAPGSCA